MIEVSGVATLRVSYSVNLEMTEDKFDALSETERTQLLEDHIDWLEVCRYADIDEIDVDDVGEMEE